VYVQRAQADEVCVCVCVCVCRDDNMAKAVALYAKVINAAGASKVRGFTTDISNYVPVEEPYMKITDKKILTGDFYS
jgi:cellulase/cellobiase CelA1